MRGDELIEILGDLEVILGACVCDHCIRIAIIGLWMHKLGLGVLVLEGRLLLVVELRRLLEGNMLLHLGWFSTIDLVGRNRL